MNVTLNDEYFVGYPLYLDHRRILPIMFREAKPFISSQGQGPKPEAQRAKSGGGVLGEGQPSRGFGNAISSPSGIRGGAPAAKGFLAF